MFFKFCLDTRHVRRSVNTWTGMKSVDSWTVWLATDTLTIYLSISIHTVRMSLDTCTVNVSVNTSTGKKSADKFFKITYKLNITLLDVNNQVAHWSS